MSELKEQKISKILVGVDGSEESLHAVDYAVDAARKYDAEVIHPILRDYIRSYCSTIHE